jgi:amino acid adenylation domain-containing protein
MRTETRINPIGLNEVETALRSHPSVDDCVVLAREVEPAGQALVAYVVLSGPFVPERLQAHLQGVLSALAAPIAFVPVACLPLTPDGKLDEQALTELEVIDGDLVGRWEERLRDVSGVEEAAVVAQELEERRPPYHLSDLIPGWKADLGAADEAPAPVGSPPAGPEPEQPRPMAHSDGGPLTIPADAPTTFTEALLRTATRYPHKGIVYVQADGSEVRQTYAELLQEARHILAGLHAEGLRPGDRVILQVESLRDHFTTFWACVLGGIIPVTVAVAPSYREANAVVNKLRNTWELLEHPAILASGRLVPEITHLQDLFRAKLVVLSVDELKLHPPTEYIHASKPTDVVFFQLTSGSTGVPKCIQETHRGVISHILGSQQFNGYSPEDVTLNWLPVDHVVPILTVHLKDLYLGCQEVQVATGRVLANPLAWLDLIETHRVTHTWSPNFGFKLVADQLNKSNGRTWDLSSIKLFMNAGEQVTLPVVHDFLSAVAPFGVRPEAMQPSFGMAEACTCMTYQNHFDVEKGVHRILKSSLGGLLRKVDRDDPSATPFVDLGPPMRGVQIRITDEHNRVVPEGVIGRFQIKGDVITPGYLNNEQANQEAFVGDGWFNSGDLGFLWDGRLTLTGREKEMIIVRGANFYCYEIEDVVNAVPGVEPTFAAACAVDDPVRGTEGLAIFFVPSAEAEQDRARLIKAIRTQVTAKLGLNPAFLIPLARGEFPKTTSGKIQRTQMKKALLAGHYDKVLKDLDVELANANTLPDWFYRPVWRPKEASAGSGPSAVARTSNGCHRSGGTLLFLDRLGLGTHLAAELGGPDRPCALVEAGTEFARVGARHFRIDAREPDHYGRLLEALAGDGFSASQIVHLWTYDGAAGEPATVEALTEAQDRGVYSLLLLTQALAQVHDAGRPVRVLVVSSNAQPAAPEDLVACEKGTLVGLVRSVSAELPFVDCRHVDLAVEPAADNAGHIVQELHTWGDREVAYRRGCRLVPRLEAVDLRKEKKHDLPFRAGGMYVLSGGLGGIGIEVAKVLLSRYQARLLLLGRTELPARETWEAHARRGGSLAERIRALEALERLGGSVRYAAVDVADPEDLRRAVDQACAQWQCAPDGVLHLAGVYREGLLTDETRESLAATLRPKVLGTWALYQLVKDRPGALFVHFSSVMGFFGGAMFGAYAAANRFLDNFAHLQRRQGQVRCCCLAWSAWKDVGMSRSHDGRQPLRASGRGIEELSVEQGLNALLAALHHDQGLLLVGLDGSKPFVRRHVETRSYRVQQLYGYFTAPDGDGVAARLKGLEVRDRFQTPSVCTLARVRQMPRTAGGEIDREQLADAGRRARRGSAERVAPRTEVERRTAEVWQEVLGIAALGIHDNFFELGGHSLLASQILSRLNEAFGADLPLRSLFEAPTVAALAERIASERRTEAGRPSPPLTPVRRQGELPLSFAQQRLWFFDQLVPGSSSYNLPSLYRLTGALDVAALEKGLSEIVRRHEALRTTSPATDGRPHQVIAPARPVRLEVRDLQHLPCAQREAEAQRLAAEEAGRPFDLARGPLFRTALFRLGVEDHLLVITTHHIVSDGWSLGVLARELTALYGALTAGEPSPLPELPVQYVDYAVWQRGWLQGETLERPLAWWLKRLAGATPLHLPTDRPRPAVPGYRGDSQSVTLPASLSRRLRELSQREGTTLFMTLLTALQVLLARLSGQDDVVVGVPVANRKAREVEALIGFFVNNLPVRADLSGDPSFRQLLSRIRESVLGDFAHQDLPFEKLVEELRLPRETGRIPLCSVLFIFQNGPAPTPDLPGLRVHSVPWEIAPRSDLDLYLWEEGEEVRGTLVFDRDLFERPTIARLVRQFQALIESAVADPDASLSSLALDESVALPPLGPAGAPAGRYPLSYHQERLWFIDQFETGTVYSSHPIYHNLPLLVHLRGPVAAEDLEAGLRAIVARHAALRTRIISAANEAFQVPDGEAGLELRVVCLAGSPVERAVEEALADARRPFALDRESPLRAVLFRLAEDESLLAVTVHHIVADRRSLEIVARELAEFCAARAEGRPPRLPEPLQYTDFTLWQRELPAGALESLLRFWKWQLRGRLAALELPADRPRPAIHTFTDAWLPVTVAAGLARRLAALGQAKGHGLEAVLLAAWKALLHRYAGQEEIVVGVAVAGRTQPGTDNLVGPLANLVVLRTDLGGDPPFAELLARVAQALRQARAHQDMPFDRLVLELKPEPDMSRTALFDVLFHFDEAPARLHFGAAQGQLIDTNLGHGKYDLHLSLRGGADGLSGSLVYNADIYDRFTAEQMLRHFEALLAGVAGDPARPVDDWPLLGAEEERRQLEAWNSTQASYPHDKTVHQLFEEQVARTPDRPAVIYEGDSLTYRQLDERANRLAHHLREQGVGPDALVAVCLERSVDLVATLLAVLKAGGAYLPLDPKYPPERLRFQVDDAGARQLITTSSLAGRVPIAVPSVTLLDTDAENIAACPASAPAPNVSPDNLIYCLYTSGSTGTPKGVLLEHRNVTRLLVNDRLQFTFGADDVWTMFHTYCFDFSVWEMYGALLYGGKLVVVPRCVTTDPAAFLALLERERVTVLNQTPTAFAALIREALDRPPLALALRYVIFGGEALHPGQLRRWRAAYPDVKLINMYGITETTVHVTFKEIGERELQQDVSNIGRPIPTTTTYVLDSRLRLLPVGVPGEMCVGGAGVGRGYLGRPELTRQRFVHNPYRPQERLYRSGDLVKHLTNGEMVYLGRMDDQVQVRGFRVELGEVRSQLLGHPAVAAADVVAWQPPGEALELAAYVVPAGEVSVASLRAHLGQSLPHYMVPSAFILLPALPMTPTGKVDRKALPSPQSARSDKAGGFVAPRDPVEEQVAAIWMQVLGVERVGIHDNFFELGGHSLRATQVVAQIWQAFQIKLPLSTLFEAPTLAELARRIDAVRPSGPAAQPPPLMSVPRAAAMPLSFAQQRLWFLDQLLPGNPSYNIPCAFRLTGELRADVLAKALGELLRRHEVLRTTFPLVDGQPVQVISPAGAHQLPLVDLGHLPEGERETAARRLAEAEAEQPFDLARGPVFRAKLLRLGAQDHRLLLTLHHIAADGWWSLEVFTRELSALYEALATGRPSPLPELPIQYADYGMWQRQWLQGEALREHVAYWKQQLGGAPWKLELPADRPRPAVQTLRGARHYFSLASPLAGAARTLSRKEGTTLFMTLLAAFKTFLYACTGQEDLVVGSPFANRTRAEIEGLIGPFVNTVVLRTRLSGDLTFRELVTRVREVVLGASVHQELPFEKVVEGLAPPRDPSRNPLFQVNFRAQTTSRPQLRLAGVTASPPEIIDTLNSKFDLALELWADSEVLGGFFEYSTDLFEKETILRMVGELERLLSEILTKPDTRVNDLEIVKAIRARRASKTRTASPRGARRRAVDL